MDAFAVESHRRLARAQDEGRLEELAPLVGPDGTLYDHDDGLRRDADLAALARLKPAFEPPHGLVTAGNSAQITDGAACLLLASGDAVRRHGLQAPGPGGWTATGPAWSPARWAWGRCTPWRRSWTARGCAAADVDYWEINEAFAAQVLACTEAWAERRLLPAGAGPGRRRSSPSIPERLNVDGGAVALGHPVGCSGARMVLHLLHVLRRTGARLGMASLCIGGGQGGAMLVAAGEGVDG